MAGGLRNFLAEVKLKLPLTGTVHAVIGNEASDADSIVSALSYAYLLNSRGVSSKEAAAMDAGKQNDTNPDCCVSAVDDVRLRGLVKKKATEIFCPVWFMFRHKWCKTVKT